jgi:hypothetical protein
MIGMFPRYANIHPGKNYSYNCKFHHPLKLTVSETIIKPNFTAPGISTATIYQQVYEERLFVFVTNIFTG